MGVPARIIEVVQELIQAVPQLSYFGPAEEDQQIAHGLPIEQLSIVVDEVV